MTLEAVLMQARARATVAAPRLMRREAARLYCGAATVFNDMESAKWIKPVVAGNRMTLFDQRQIDACIDRLADGEYPTPKAS